MTCILALYAVGLFIQGATCLGVEANDCPWNLDEWVIMIFALLLLPSYLGWLLAASEIYRLAKRRSETELHARNGGSLKPGVLDVAPPGPSAESDRVAGGLGLAKLGKLAKFCRFLAGSFSAVSEQDFARKYAFDSIFQALQDLHPFAPLQSQNFSKTV